MLLDHVMLRVEELEESINWYEEYFEYEELGRWEADSFTNVYLAPKKAVDQNAMIELTYNHDNRTYTEGNAWKHIGIRVRDANVAYDELTDTGAKGYWEHSGFMEYPVIESNDGHKFQLVEKPYGNRFSLDHTMVQATDLGRTVEWYSRVLNFQEEKYRNCGGSEMIFMKPEGAGREAMGLGITNQSEVGEIGDSWGHLSLRVSDLVEQCWPKLMRLGAVNYRSPAACAPFNYSGNTTGIRHTNGPYAFTKDCDGRELELLEV